MKYYPAPFEFPCPGIQILVYEDDTADISITNVQKK